MDQAGVLGKMVEVELAAVSVLRSLALISTSGASLCGVTQFTGRPSTPCLTRGHSTRPREEQLTGRLEMKTKLPPEQV